MNLAALILLIFAGIIILIFLIGLFMTKKHYARSEIVINAPLEKVFDYLRFIKNQDEFNGDAMTSPERTKEFKGTDGSIGYVYSWSGDKKVGVGEKEIMNIVEGRKIEMQIRFTKPMRTMGTMVMETDPLPGNQTKVTWTNYGRLFYPVNILIPLMQKFIKRNLDKSLVTLKAILEK